MIHESNIVFDQSDIAINRTIVSRRLILCTHFLHLFYEEKNKNEINCDKNLFFAAESVTKWETIAAIIANGFAFVCLIYSTPTLHTVCNCDQLCLNVLIELNLN